MAEVLNLDAPDQATPGTPDYRLLYLGMTLDGPDGSFIHLTLQGANGLQRAFVYEGAIARALIVALNKADLSMKSLQRRILERLIADGKLAGSVSGAPE